MYTVIGIEKYEGKNGTGYIYYLAVNIENGTGVAPFERFYAKVEKPDVRVNDKVNIIFRTGANGIYISNIKKGV